MGAVIDGEAVEVPAGGAAPDEHRPLPATRPVSREVLMPADDDLVDVGAAPFVRALIAIEQEVMH